MDNITVKRLKDICSKHKYIMVRFRSGHPMGINCGVAFMDRNKNYEPSNKTAFISYNSINFMEYISIKHPFLTQTNKQ